jgi:hypothetical protein
MDRDRASDDVAKAPDATMSRWLRSMVSRSRQRARTAGIGHTLADGYATVLFDLQKGLCAVTGLKFSLNVFPDVLVKHPFAPSLDRTLSSGGYDPENVRLVCIAVNFGMGEWGQELYLTFARAAVQLDRSIDTLASVISVPRCQTLPSMNVAPKSRRYLIGWPANERKLPLPRLSHQRFPESHYVNRSDV